MAVKRSPDYFMREIERANKGRLKIYLGAAPGVGKTYHMLQDANEMKKRGIDVVIGFVETYGRKDTEEQIGDLEIIRLFLIAREKGIKKVVLPFNSSKYLAEFAEELAVETVSLNVHRIFYHSVYKHISSSLVLSLLISRIMAHLILCTL